MTVPSPESIRAALDQAARGRFGAQRAEALGDDLAALAADLARVAATPLPADGEPAFYLTTDGASPGAVAP